MQYGGNDVWEAQCFRIGPDDQNWPWLVCITCSSSNLFLARDVFKTQPTSSDLWKIILQATKSPNADRTPRPRMLEVKPDAMWDALEGQLKEIGIQLAPSFKLPYPDGFPEWIDEVWQEWEEAADQSTPD